MPKSKSSVEDKATSGATNWKNESPDSGQKMGGIGGEVRPKSLGKGGTTR